jgi:hypothetical protein
MDYAIGGREASTEVGGGQLDWLQQRFSSLSPTVATTSPTVTTSSPTVAATSDESQTGLVLGDGVTVPGGVEDARSSETTGEADSLDGSGLPGEQGAGETAASFEGLGLSIEQEAALVGALRDVQGQDTGALEGLLGGDLITAFVLSDAG